MALPAITPTDFKGDIDLPQIQYEQAFLSSFINTYYPRQVREVLGDAAYITIRDQVTLDQKWIDLFNGADYTNEDGDLKTFEGLIVVCRYFIYFEYLRKLSVKASATGLGVNANENHVSVVAINAASNNYNEGVRILQDEIYPFVRTFEKVSEVATNSSEVAGVSTISVASTKYLANGNTVEIDSIEYEVSNVVENVSFEITTTTGQDFTGKTVVWKPFENFPLPCIGYVFI